MSWNQQNGQQNGNGQRQGLKIPDPGKGRLRLVDKLKSRDASKAPDFRGLVNCDGHVMWLSIWYNPAKQGNTGMMPEGWSVAAQTYDPNSQGQQAQAPQQPQYGQPPQQPPQGHYAPPPQNGGYTPAPGYTPPAPPPQTAPPPAQGGWGGRPQQGQQQQRALSPGDPPF